MNKRQQKVKDIFIPVGIDNFNSEIKEAKRPVLLAYIAPGFEYRDQFNVIESVSRRYFGDSLKVCLLNKDFVTARAYRGLVIGETPVFIVFFKGNVRGRMTGRADKETLYSFLSKALLKIQDEERIILNNNSQDNEMKMNVKNGQRKKPCGFCSHIKEPYEDCYCFKMTSQKIRQALYYCQNNFKECEIYKRLSEGDKMLSVLAVDDGTIA
ncbi:MAG: hypothetical protein JRD05_03420 [Deltaproteobacteria bacterium]|nr:hypothetical protein [Deltaproteobacteria bacterium]